LFKVNIFFDPSFFTGLLKILSKMVYPQKIVILNNKNIKRTKYLLK